MPGCNRLLVAGTGNKVEDFGIGFFTKYGDGGVDLSPIADLTKTEVYAVAKALGVIDSILEAPPTDGLWGDSTHRCGPDRSDLSGAGVGHGIQKPGCGKEGCDPYRQATGRARDLRSAVRGEPT